MAKKKKKKKKNQPIPHYESEVVIIKSGAGGNPRNRLLIVTPTLGIVRIEWAIQRYGQAIPCNFSAGSATLGIGFTVPMHYLVADAQNLGCEDVVNKNYEWLLLWEDDVLPPFDALLRLNHYMMDGNIPVVSGLYFTKGNFSEPVLYRGNGRGCFKKFKIGDKVWADGVPTGFLLIHGSLIKLMWEESEQYQTIGGRVTRKVFETPSKVFYNPENKTFAGGGGTSDLNWCKRVIEEKVLTRAGWPKIGRKKYPFLCDTNIFCRHILLDTGEQFPKF